MNLFELAMMKKGGNGAGGVSSWNDLTDKPFYAEQAFEPIVLDPNNLPPENIITIPNIGDAKCYKLLDSPIAIEAHDGIEWRVGADKYLFECFPELCIDGYCYASGILAHTAYGAVQAIISIFQPIHLGDFVFEDVGTFLIFSENLNIGRTATIKGRETIKTIDEKYLPESAKSGLSIKKIEFTDRPTLYAWLQNNNWKVLKASIYTRQREIPFYSTDFVVNVSVNADGEFECYTFMALDVTKTGTNGVPTIKPYFNAFSIHYDETVIESGISGEECTTTEIPDEYWEQMGVAVTVYYIE